jgi:methylated-DNA-[protein]-cysteine S-methyltransferase
MTTTPQTPEAETPAPEAPAAETPAPGIPSARELFAALPEVDEDAQRRLRGRLVAAATEAGVLDVAYRTVDTPLGALLLAATEAGLVRVAFALEDHDRVLAQLAGSVSPRVLRAPARLDLAAREVEEYFAGRRTGFDLPLDLQLSSGFRRTVLTHLPDIAYGTTASYATIAAAAGNPKAVRAVGTACATNPLPVVVPCHRVVRSDGTVGQYVGGTDAKKALLSLEAAA